MFDTVKIRLDLSNNVEPHKCLSLLRDVKEIASNTGHVIAGSLNNLNVTLTGNCLFLSGSLAKYFFGGENQSTLTRQATKQALECLADQIQMPVLQADVYRVDVAANLVMKEKEVLYFPFLGKARFYTRLMQPNSLYYNSWQKQMVFYGKVIEQKAKLTNINPAYIGQNLLRYELRLKRKIKKQLNLSEFKAQSLYDPVLYHALIKRWHNEYKAIFKQEKAFINQIPNKATMTNSKNFQRFLMQIGIEALGGTNEVLQLVENAKELNYFTNKMQAGRLREMIIEAVKFETGLAEKNDLLGELDKRVNEVARLHL